MESNYEALLKEAKTADLDGQPATAAECLLTASRLNPTLPPWASLRLAENLRLLGRIAEARKVLQEIGDYPADKAWLVNVHRGQVEQDAGELQAAAYRFETALEQSPTGTIPYIHLACAYSVMQRRSEAIEVLLRGLTAEGDRDEVYLNLGHQYRALRDYARAERAYRKAIELSPDYSEAEIALHDVVTAQKAATSEPLS